MIVFILAVQLCLVAHISAQDCDAAKGPIQDLNTPAPNDLRIVHTSRFLCGGVIESYDLFAKATGSIYMAVWRPQELGGIVIRTWTLISMQKIQITQTGAQTITIPRAERMEVNAHDCIGFHYDAGAPGIIPFEDDSVSPRKFNGPLVRVYKEDRNSGNLNVGTAVTGKLIRNTVSPALNAHLEPKPACILRNGGCDQVCDDATGVALCDCNPGYQLEDDEVSCTDIDECATGTSNCDGGCTNTGGSYTCSCGDGFTLNGDGHTCDADLVDECASNNGGCEDICTDTDDSFVCSCSSGSTLNNDGRTCDVDLVDECASNNGGCEDICTDTDDSFVCSCSSGSTLNNDGRSCDAVEVPQETCGGRICDHFCVTEDNKEQCACRDGFLLARDKKTCEEYDPVPESMFMLQAYSANRDRVCYSLDFGSATHLRLIHDEANDITVNGRLQQSAAPDHPDVYYFSHVSFKRGNVFMIFSYDKVLIDGTEYSWDNVNANIAGYEIAMRRPGEAVTVKFRVPRKQIILLFDRSIEFATNTERVEATIFRNPGFSSPLQGVIGAHYKNPFAPAAGAEKGYENPADFTWARGDTKASVSMIHHNARNGRKMQCWEITEKISVDAADKLTELRG